LAAQPGLAAGRPVVGRPVVVDPSGLPYAERRAEIYGSLTSEGIFTWDSMYGEEYALASLHRISQSLRDELMEASYLLCRVYARVVAVVQTGDEQLLEYLGIPQAAWSAVRTELPELSPTLIGRFDFAPTANGIKMLEFNAETPTDIVEAYHVNGRVCEYFGEQNPNAGLTDHICDAFAHADEYYRFCGYEVKRKVFSSVDWHTEDSGTTKYLMALSSLDGEFVPLKDLRVLEDRLQVFQEEMHTPVDLWYRLHPLEKLSQEKDVDGFPTGAAVLDLIARQKIALINPPSALIAQSKALQALIWNLHEGGGFFTPEEDSTIGKYMLPTYFENRFSGHTAYVTKPFFGREGGAVTIFQADGQELARDQEESYWDQPFIYQQFVELEPITIETLAGLYCGRLMYGSFVINGRGSAIVARVGGRITGNMAYYLPLSVSS